MNGHELPDDLSRWPGNPYDLLGVRFGVSPRELRRAYAALIRVYKPEQFPEHFRRIREAYETVLRYANLFSGTDAPAPAEPLPAPAEPTAEDTPPPPEAEAREARPRVPVRSLPELLDELWQTACSGEEADAYRGLLDLHARYPGHTEVCLRLYWLLAIAPDLDPRRSPCDWLVRGLHASGLTGPLRELYRRELDEHPDEALSVRCTRLLTSRVDPGLTLELARWRWQAAVRLNEWKLIGKDLEELRPWLAHETEEAWARLLLAAVEQLAWAGKIGPRPLLERYGRELNQLEHISTRLEEAWDQRDFTLEVAAGWHRLKEDHQGPPALLQLIYLAATRPPDEIRPLLLAVVEQVARQPEGMLIELDVVHRRAPAVLGRFGQLMLLLGKDGRGLPPESRSPADLLRLTMDFLHGVGRARPQDFRIELLQFCMREAIAPETVAELAEGHLYHWLASHQPLAGIVAADWPMRHVFLAHRLYWA